MYVQSLSKRTCHLTLFQANMIYLARITDRVPVIPPFVPLHIGEDAGSLPFGDVFNITRLSRAIESPVVQWSDVKKPGSRIMDEVGCWDIWQPTQYEEQEPRDSRMPRQLNLGVLECFYPVPSTETTFFIRHIVYTGSGLDQINTERSQ
jgi:hypothetical protein